MRTIFKKMTFAGVVLFCFAGMVVAQPMNPHTRAAIQTEMDRQARERRATRQQQNTGPSAAEVRAWHARERKIQAEIAQHKATPYWMAIGWDAVNKGILWPGGYASEQRAIQAVQQNCKSSRCEILATFANGCAVMVTANDKPRRREDFFIGVDKDDRKAAEKARRTCIAAHGDGQDRCFYSEIKTGKGVEGTAFCVGYDYSLYNQK